MIKKIFAILIIAVFAVGILSQAAFAIELPPPGPNQPQPTITPPSATSVDTPGEWLQLLRTIANWVFAVLIVVSVFMVLYAAFLFLTSAGSPEKTNQARGILMWAAVGIIVAILAFVFPNIIATFIGTP
ncbi:MAG: hypothetical protein HYW95_02320 [Candidatus Wildermuthbacteria bacterium]|nr:hypothetical protein [Candidatus Wildermuthbacteria bacterium]